MTLTLSIELEGQEAVPAADDASAVDRAGVPDGDSARHDQAKQMVVSVERPARGKKLRQIAELLAELDVNVVSGDVTSVGDVAKDTFHVRYFGTLSPSELAAHVRARLRETLQLQLLLPGDAVVTPPESFVFTVTEDDVWSFLRPEADDTPPPPSPTKLAKLAYEDTGDVVLGIVDLRALAVMLAAADNPDSELWLRYLQACTATQQPQPRNGHVTAT